MGVLTNKTALVTGAGRGIGRAIANRFAEEGARVAVVSRTLENANTVADELRSKGANATGFSIDVSDPEATEAGITAILNEFQTIDILVNNAGVTRDGLLMRMPLEDWNTVIDTNLRSAFVVTKTLARQFAKLRSGSVINVASVVGLKGNVGQANYAASKAGLIGMTKSVAKELAARGIRVNAIAPGFITTDMTDAMPDKAREAILSQIPLGRLGAVEDVAEAALFLASDAASYITGHTLSVDGGMAM